MKQQMRRLALLLLVPLALLGSLAAAPLGAAEDAEEADESAWVEEAFEECEGDPICEEEVEAEEAEAEGRYPAECVLRSAKAHGVLKKNKLKLTIGYTASEPTQALMTVRYGATKLASVKRRLRRSGVLRVTRQLKGKPSERPLVVRIELDPEGTACPTRRLMLVPKR